MRTQGVFLTTILALASASHAGAIFTTSTDRAAFMAASQSVDQAPVPNTGHQAGGVGAFGDLTVSLAGNATELYFGAIPTLADWSTLIPGADIAISNDEHIDFAIGFSAFAFGFDIDEPTSPDRHFGAYFVDSTFEVTLRFNGAFVGSFQFNPANDVRAFIGVHSDTAFNQVQLRELNSPADDGGEDEFFGNFVTGRVALPAPGAGALAAVGCLALVRRRR